MAFNLDHLIANMPRLLEATLINLRLALLIVALSLVLGTVLTVLRSLKIRPINIVIDVLISFVRGTPLLIQIFLFFYALPAVGIDLGPQTAGVLAISINSAAFITEIMRGSLPTIDPGHIEAATALGLSPAMIWAFVILPQLFRKVLPSLVNEATIVVKGTALLSVITVVEVLRTAQQIGSASFRPFETLVGAALCFLALNLLVGFVGQLLERRNAAGRA